MQMQQTMLNIVESNPNLTESVTVLCLTVLVFYAKKFLFEKIIKKVVIKTSTNFDDEVYPLVNRMFSLIIWFSGIIFILIKLGVNINALITTIGASSLLIAYGCKDTLTNIISGVVILADKIFQIGDFIELPTGEFVMVVSIGLRRSKFLFDPDNVKETRSIIILPNCELIKKKIKNYTMGKSYNDV